jgi:ABC-type antimicrobial peptide transport system permease subunit
LAYAIALIIALGAALFIDAKTTSTISSQAVLIFNSQDINKTFHLIGFNPLDLLEIAGFALGTGLLATFIPLLTNIRRNPVKDMREE